MHTGKSCDVRLLLFKVKPSQQNETWDVIHILEVSPALTVPITHSAQPV